MQSFGFWSRILIGLSFASLSLGFSQQSGRFPNKFLGTTSSFLLGTGVRIETHPVNFQVAFSTIPQVHLSISQIDTEYTRDFRIDVSAGAFKTTGFELYYCTWGDSILYQIDVDWLAYSP